MHIRKEEATVNITWGGKNTELRDPVSFLASDAQILRWVNEALRTGSVAGIGANEGASVSDHVVDRFAATAAKPINRIFIRPKTPFG